MTAYEMCSVPDCEKELYTKGLCQTHYHRVRRTGSLEPQSKRGNMSPKDRTCPECGKTFVTVWGRQIYCEPCGTNRRMRASRRGGEARREVKSEVVRELAKTAGKQETRLLDIQGHPEFEWVTYFSIPFMPAVSKNRRWSNTGQGTVFLTADARDYQDMVIAKTKTALKDREIKQNKLWLSFLVEKPNNRFDAVNVVDSLCDAIKKATDLDDRWFAIGKIDWVIRKTDPSIIISVAQESCEHVIICSHCGEMKSLEHYGNRKRNPLGKMRVCKSCKSTIDAAARKARRPL